MDNKTKSLKHEQSFSENYLHHQLFFSNKLNKRFKIYKLKPTS